MEGVVIPEDENNQFKDSQLNENATLEENFQKLAFEFFDQYENDENFQTAENFEK